MKNIPEGSLESPSFFQGSKWLKIPLYLSLDELKLLFEILSPFYLVKLSGVIESSKTFVAIEEYLSEYAEYLRLLQSGENIIPNRLVVGMSKELSDFRKFKVEGGELIKIHRPVVQIQPYTLHYSETSETFIEMTHSSHNFYFGLLFSFPQLFQDPETEEVIKVYEQNIPNALVFKTIQKFARAETIPTPFSIKDKKVNHPARISRNIACEINQRSELKAKGIKICL